MIPTVVLDDGGYQFSEHFYSTLVNGKLTWAPDWHRIICFISVQKQGANYE